MKVRKNADIIQFLKEVRNCPGGVFFVSDSGDRLDLKSVLSQYIFSVAVNQEKMREGGEIVCERAEDYSSLSGYLVQSSEIRREKWQQM